MCSNIAKKAGLSSPILIYDLSSARTAQVHAEIPDTTPVTSIREAAQQSDIIFYSVTDDHAVTAVLEEILSSTNVEGKLIVDCSTVHPDTTDHESDLVQSKGGSFVACPVFGAAAMADAGELICVLAGPAAAVEQVKPFCTGVMGKAIIDLTGDKPGQATRLKILGNSFVLNMVEALSEGHVVAEKSGLSCANLHKFIEIMFPGPYTAYSDRMMSGDYHRREVPLFSVQLGRKDARHARSIAQQAGTDMRNVELADMYLQTVEEQTGPTGEMCAMYGAKRLEAGLPFKNC
jgi:3-hydroxyisobutyrate dehydrogenase-like beta-hydroxyacid dehydrogenase